MTPEDYLRDYTGPFQPPPADSGPRQDGAELMLARGYYYPPYLEREAYLDMLDRAELLEIAQRILAAEYPQQRPTRRQVGDYLENWRNVKEERAWRQVEMERQAVDLTDRAAELKRLDAERQRLEAELARRAAELNAQLAEHQGQITRLDKENRALRASLDEMRASTSWKVTAPFRWLSQAFRARAPEI